MCPALSLLLTSPPLDLVQAQGPNWSPFFSTPSSSGGLCTLSPSDAQHWLQKGAQRLPGFPGNSSPENVCLSLLLSPWVFLPTSPRGIRAPNCLHTDALTHPPQLAHSESRSHSDRVVFWKYVNGEWDSNVSPLHKNGILNEARAHSSSAIFPSFLMHTYRVL